MEKKLLSVSEVQSENGVQFQIRRIDQLRDELRSHSQRLSKRHKLLRYSMNFLHLITSLSTTGFFVQACQDSYWGPEINVWMSVIPALVVGARALGVETLIANDAQALKLCRDLKMRLDNSRSRLSSGMTSDDLLREIEQFLSRAEEIAITLELGESLTEKVRNWQRMNHTLQAEGIIGLPSGWSKADAPEEVV